MTKKHLEEYKVLSKEIDSLRIQISEKAERDQELNEKLNRLLEECETKKLKVEKFIADIEDVTTRLIFRYVYLEHMTQMQAGRKLFMDQSVVSKRITKYLSLVPSEKVHLNTSNSTIVQDKYSHLLPTKYGYMQFVYRTQM